MFRHLRSDRVVRPPSLLGVSKRSVVELSGKDQQIALAEYSRLVALFLVLGQYLTQLWQVKSQIIENSMIFQLYESILAKFSIVAAWDLHQRVPRSILHGEWCVLMHLGEYLRRIVLIDDAVSHRRRHRSDSWVMTKVGIPNFVSGPREYIMEGEYVILAMCSWFRISWFRIICWHCWCASGNKWITYVDLLRPLKNHGLIVFILTYTPWLLCHGFAF